MKPLFVRCCAASLALLLLVARAGASPNGSTAPADGLRDNTPTAHALVNARIVVAPGQVIEKGVIVIRDGLIAEVGEKVECPGDCRKWDLTGKTVYPGLIDSYAELPGDDKPVAGPGHWSPQVTPQARAEQQYKIDAAANQKLRGQGIALRLIVPGGGIIRGTSALVSTGDQDLARALVKDEVALHVEPTLRPGRDRDRYPNSPMGAVALARQAFYDADWYAKAWDAYRAKNNLPRPERNVALETLARYRNERLPVVIDTSDELYFLRANQLAAEFGLNAIIRGSGQEYRRLDAIRATGFPVILPVDFPKAPNVATPEAALVASLEDLLDWDHAPENPARLEKAGVRFALTTHGLKDAGDFLAAVRKSVERGLSADAALKALTTTPAALFGLSDRYGSVEHGKVANLVVASGDLFGKGTKIVETWIDGRRYEAPATPRFDLRGTWEATLTVDGQPQVFELKLAGEPAKLSGTIRRQTAEAKDAENKNDAPQEEQPKDNAAKPDDKSDADKAEGKSDENADENKDKKPPKKNEATLKQPNLVDALFTASFEGEPFDWPGVIQLSATVLQPAEAGQADALQLLGQVMWSGGNQSPLIAKRTAAYDPKTDPGKPAEEKKEEAAKDSATKEDADKAAADETKKPVSDVEGNETQTRPAEHATPEAKAASDQTPIGEKTEGKAKVQVAALYPVNYPLSAFGVSAAPEQPQHVLFKNATVWTSGPEGKLEGAAVLVTEGRIAAVGKDVAAPEGAVVVDATGKHITPGIIDCHSHIATDGGVNESGQAITAEVRIGDFIDANDVNIYRQLAGGVTTINVLHGSANPIGGQNQVIKLRWGGLPEELKFAQAPQGIKFALGENVKQANWGERYTSRYPQTRMGVEQIIRDEFEAAKAYRQAQEDWRRSPTGPPPRVDLELEAVAEILEGKRLIHCHSYRQDEILAFMRVCEEYGVRIATLQHILEGYKVADVMAKHGVGGSSFSDWWAYKFEVYDAIPYNGALLHNAGVTVSFNSDDAELARRLNLEAAKAVKYGEIQEIEALKFVTLNPARQLGIDKQVGSLEPGKDADLVVWSGSPLSVYSHAEQTWLDGRKYFDRAADLARREEIQKMRAALVQKILLSQAEMAAAGEERSAAKTYWPREDLFCGHHGHDEQHRHHE